MNRVIVMVFVVLLCSCGETIPRKPIQVKSGSFYKASVTRSKEILAQEEAVIQSLIEKDTSHTYFSSADGFWYHYEVQNAKDEYRPKTNDEIVFTYNVMTLQGDTIYKKSTIGLVQHAIDKSQLFPGLRNGLKLLKSGEQATFIFPSSQAYGYKGDTGKIAPLTPIKSSVNVLKIIRRTDSLN